MANSLSPQEQNITLELSNLIGGVISGTITMLTGLELDAGTPEISTVDNAQALFAELPSLGALASVQYQSGFQGPMAFVMDLEVATTLADLMMGSPPTEAPTEITDMQLSAVGEALSQMTGAISSNLSQFLSHPVDLSMPSMVPYTTDALLEAIPDLMSAGAVLVAYPLKIQGALANTKIYQIVPISAALQNSDVVKAQVPAFQQADAPVPAMAGAGYAEASGGGGGGGGGGANPVTVRPVEFTSFDNHVSPASGINKNLDLVMDVCLNLTVELGRTELSIKDVLELTRGSVIELNRIAGEPVDLFANGKMIAKGEVVVIEDNFGLRITSIVAPADRLRGL